MQYLQSLSLLQLLLLGVIILYFFGFFAAIYMWRIGKEAFQDKFELNPFKNLMIFMVIWSTSPYHLVQIMRLFFNNLTKK